MIDKLMVLADRIIVLKDGNIIEQGSPNTLLKNEEYLKNLGLVLPEEEATPPSPQIEISDVIDEESQASADVTDETENLLNDTRRKKADFSVYKYYFTSSGHLTIVLFLASMGVWVFFTEFPGMFDFPVIYFD